MIESARRILVAGFATRHVARSAHRAGYEVYAVDHFCDQDLAWYTKDRLKFDDLADLPVRVEEMASKHRIDAMVATSGAEELIAPIPIAGTPRETIELFLDKLSTQQFFETIRVPVPPLSAPGTYPALVKPRRGAGGWRNQIVRTPAEEEAWQSHFPDLVPIRQQVIDGIAASVSCVANGRNARAVAVNRQLLRGGETAAYGFSGSVTPICHPLAERMAVFAEQIAAASGCIGSIGIDFVLGAEPWAIEVNPRFQATVDTVEAATGENIFALHMDACRGILPGVRPMPRCSAARRILFAQRDGTVGADLTTLAPSVADIPWPGTVLEEGEAIVSILSCGSNPEEACRILDARSYHVCRLLGGLAGM